MNKELNYWVRPAVKYKGDINVLVSNVCNHYGITETQMRSKCRLRKFVDARNIIMYVMYKAMDFNDTRIGEYLNMDRTSVIHGVKKVENLKDFDSNFKELINRFV